MEKELRVAELLTLKTIAEHLNEATQIDHMLGSVLQKLLELTGLKAGWIFLVDEEPRYRLMADCGLPPALGRQAKRPMKRGGCWCLERFWDGRLHSAVNILNCKRLEKAVQYKWGDTEGISHHATIPLRSGSQLHGILNVASPGKQHFADEELALLQSVAFQIGTAIERSKLYAQEQKRAAGFAKLGEFTRRIGAVLETSRIPDETVRCAGELFGWSPVRFWTAHEGATRYKRAEYAAGKAQPSVDEETSAMLKQAIDTRSSVVRGGSAVVPVPTTLPRLQLLEASLPDGARFDQADIEVLTALADHIGLALENACLYEQRRELAGWEERNRLARDLHDSVNQTLYSLHLTARGLESGLAQAPVSEAAAEAVREIGGLAAGAMKEMRSLILQLRPEGLEDGLMTALVRYAERFGLEPDLQVDGVVELPRRVEEALWRIGQEAVNNSAKYAGTKRVRLAFRIENRQAKLTVEDEGNGFEPEDVGRKATPSLGLRTMVERAEALGGYCRIRSAAGKGTAVEAAIPIEEGGGAGE